MDYIVKRIFTKDDIVDLKIAHFSYIDEINIHCISVKAVHHYYELQPKPSIAELNGLMLIEIVLFDPKKFLKENTRRSPKE